MLLFGHIGITAGAVKACDILRSMTELGNGYQPDSGSNFNIINVGVRLRLYHWLDGIKTRVGLVDYRLVLLGSLLPDIIDKSVWLIVGSHFSLSGRDYGHTLLFNLVLLIAGLVLFRYRKSWLFIISLSSFMHLILDKMWNRPVALLWPLLGPLPKEETTGWFFNMLQVIFSQPEAYVPEIIGLVIVLLFAYRLVAKKRVIGFLKRGTIE